VDVPRRRSGLARLDGLALEGDSTDTDVRIRSLVVQIQEELHGIGVEAHARAQLSTQLYAGYGAGGTLSRQVPTGDLPWYAGVDPDDSILYRCDQFPPQGWNISRFCDPRVEAAEDEAIASNDVRTRARAYGTIASLLVAERPFETLWFVRNVNVYNSDLKNFRPAHAVTEIWNPWQLDI